MAAYTWGDVAQMVTFVIFALAYALLLGATFSIDYPPYELRANKFITDPAAVTACNTAAAGGDTSCVRDFYNHRAWKPFEWWVYYFTPIVVLIEIFFVAVYLRWQKYGVTWILMVIVGVLGAIWLIMVIIATSVWWAECAKHSACSNARYVYDFTGYVKQSTASAWIALNVSYYIIVLCHIALFIFSLLTQACLSRSVNGRETGLDALFTPEDAARVESANQRVESPLDGNWLSRLPPTPKLTHSD